MKTYTVQDGDDLERVSTIAYGSADQAALIKNANPHAIGGLVSGMVLTIPARPDAAPLELPPDVASLKENEVAVTVDGKRFHFWTEVELVRSIDSFDQFTMAAPFEPDNQAFRDVFTPLKFQRAVLHVEGKPLFTGTLLNPTPTFAADGRTASCSGYALAGVLNDATTPPSGDLEFDSMTLRDIATAMAKPFGLLPVFEADPGAALDRVAIGPEERILQFWAKEARQRNLVIGNNELGQPVFRRSTNIPPVQGLQGGASPVLSVSPQFDGQQYFSHITARTPSTIGVDGSQYTVENPHLRGVLRPHVFTADDTLSADSVEAAKAKMGRMFADAIAYRVELAGWKNALGNLWAPNTRVNLLAPSAMVYNETDFLIRRVTLRRTPKQDTATLELVLPGSFEGIVPARLPWDS